MPGGATLTELRQAWLTAEAALRSGTTPRVAPFADLRDAAALLQRAGFAQPVADSDRLTVSYSDPLDLMHDLKKMGESNMLMERDRAVTSRSLLAAAAAAYRHDFQNSDGRVPATFELLFLTAWSGFDPTAEPPA